MKQRITISAEFKTKVVLELIAGKKSLSEAGREYEIKDTVLTIALGRREPPRSVSVAC
jgi:hypothetical protein